MALRIRQNPYRGINAHLHSFLQRERDGWVVFHSSYITHLADAIDAVLPEGYEVSEERSLQIRQIDPITGQETVRVPEPDVTVWSVGEHEKTGFSPAPAVGEAVLTVPVVETLMRPAEESLKAVIISEYSPGGLVTPLVRLELLSPSNKVGVGKLIYLSKRDATLQSGTVLVELDFLHESESPVPGVPSYRRANKDGYPYTLILSDPRPSIYTGNTHIFGVPVNQALPAIPVSLLGTDQITIDFESVYQTTFANKRYFSNRADYSADPVAMETYRPDDQARIRAVMAAVLNAHAPQNKG